MKEITWGELHGNYGVFTRFMCDLHPLFILVIGSLSTWVILVIALSIISTQTIYFEGKTKLKSCSLPPMAHFKD